MVFMQESSRGVNEWKQNVKKINKYKIKINKKEIDISVKCMVVEKIKKNNRKQIINDVYLFCQSLKWEGKSNSQYRFNTHDRIKTM